MSAVENELNLLQRGRVAVAGLAALGSLGFAGCTASSEHHSSSPTSVERTLGQEAQLYQQELNLSKDVAETYIPPGPNTPSIAKLNHDLSDRDSSIPVAAQWSHTAGTYNPVPGLKTGYYDGYYSTPNVPDSLAIWTIDRIDPATSTTTKFLPITQITAGPNNNLKIVDQRPIITRQNHQANTNFQALIDDVIEPASPVISLGFQSGQIKDLEVVYDNMFQSTEDQFGAESSYFDPKQQEEIIVLPKQPSGFSDIRNIITHETGHALFSKAPISQINNTPDTSASAAELKQACVAIKDAAFQEIGSQLNQLIPLYQAYDKVITDSHAEISYIIGQIAAGQYYKLQYTSSFPGMTADDVPECMVTNPNAVVGLVRQNILHDTSKPESITDKQFNTIANLKDTFSAMLRSTPVMEAIAEHGYVSDKMIGHPEDGVDEMAASLFDIALNYPDQFQTKVEQLPPSAAQAVEQAYNIIRQDFITANPELVNLMPDLFNK